MQLVFFSLHVWTALCRSSQYSVAINSKGDLDVLPEVAALEVARVATDEASPQSPARKAWVRSGKLAVAGVKMARIGPNFRSFLPPQLIRKVGVKRGSRNSQKQIITATPVLPQGCRF